MREIQFTVPSDASYEDYYTINWNGSAVLQHLYAPNGADILKLEKQPIWDYFKWGFVYISFNPVGLASQYGLDGLGLWKVQMNTIDLTAPSLYIPDGFHVSMHRYEYMSTIVTIAAGENYTLNLPPVPNWYTGTSDLFRINATSSQVDVSPALLDYSYGGISYAYAYAYSYWRPYNQTIVIKNLGVSQLSIEIRSFIEVFRLIDYQANAHGLNFTIDSEVFDSAISGYYLSLDITKATPWRLTTLYTPNGTRADALFRIIKNETMDDYYMLSVVYGVYRVGFDPYLTWNALENDIYGTWNLTFRELGDLGSGIPPTFYEFDGKVDGKDLSLFLLCFKGLAGPDWRIGDLGGGMPPVFFAYDGKVDGKDLSLFLMCFKGQGP